MVAVTSPLYPSICWVGYRNDALTGRIGEPRCEVALPPRRLLWQAGAVSCAAASIEDILDGVRPPSDAEGWGRSLAAGSAALAQMVAWQHQPANRCGTGQTPS